MGRSESIDPEPELVGFKIRTSSISLPNRVDSASSSLSDSPKRRYQKHCAQTTKTRKCYLQGRKRQTHPSTLDSPYRSDSDVPSSVWERLGGGLPCLGQCDCDDTASIASSYSCFSSSSSSSSSSASSASSYSSSSSSYSSFSSSSSSSSFSSSSSNSANSYSSSSSSINPFSRKPHIFPSSSSTSLSSSSSSFSSSPFSSSSKKQLTSHNSPNRKQSPHFSGGRRFVPQYASAPGESPLPWTVSYRHTRHLDCSNPDISLLGAKGSEWQIPPFYTGEIHSWIFWVI